MLLSEDPNIIVEIGKRNVDLQNDGLDGSIDRLDIPLYLNCLDIFAKTILLF